MFKQHLAFLLHSYSQHVTFCCNNKYCIYNWTGVLSSFCHSICRLDFTHLKPMWEGCNSPVTVLSPLHSIKSKQGVRMTDSLVKASLVRDHTQSVYMPPEEKWNWWGFPYYTKNTANIHTIGCCWGKICYRQVHWLLIWEFPLQSKFQPAHAYQPHCCFTVWLEFSTPWPVGDNSQPKNKYIIYSLLTAWMV